jgi:tetratricopeptide (TPR) repeat protein
MGEEEDRALGELVLRRGYISMEQLHVLLLEAERSDRPLAAILLKNQLLTPAQLDEIVEQLQNPTETSQLDAVPVEGPTPVPPPPPPVKIPKPAASAPPPSSKTKIPVQRQVPAMPPRSKPVPTVAARNTRGLFKAIVVMLILAGLGAAGYFYVWPLVKPADPPPPPPPSEKLAKMYYEDDSSAVQEQIDKSLRFNPNDPEAHYWQGRMALRDYWASVRVQGPWRLTGKVEVEPPYEHSAFAVDLQAKTLDAFDKAAKHAAAWKLAHRMPTVEGIRKLFVGQASDAVASLKQAVEASEDDPEVRVLYALALYLDGKFDEAMAEAKRRVNHSLARVIFARACHGAGWQRPDEASDLFASGLKMLPKDPTVPVLSAKVELLLAHYELLRDESLQQAQDLSGPLAIMDEGLGSVGLVSEAVARLREEQGLGTQAVAKYQNAIDLFGRAGKGTAWNLRRAFARLAFAEYQRSRGMGAAITTFKEAESAFRAEGLKDHANYAATQVALLKSEKPFDRVQAYEKQIAEAVDPLFKARARLEFAKFEANRGADATALFEGALADAASDPWLKLEIQREQARAKFEPAPFEIPSDRKRFEHWVAVADTYQLSAELKSRKSEDPGQDFNEALKAFDEALKLRPESASVLARLASTRLLRARHWGRTGGDPSADEAEAVKIVDAALKRSVESGELLLVRAEVRLGFASRAVTDLNAAIQDATDALKISPALVRAYTVRAMAQIQKGILNSKPGSNPEKELTDAIADCAAALNLAEGNVDALWQRGRARLVWGEFRLARSQDPMNDLNAAVGDLSQSLRLRRGDPFISGDRAHTFSLIGKFRLSKGQEDVESFKKCVEDATKAIEKTKTDPTLYFDRGRANYYINKFEACIADLEEAKKLNPKLAEEADTLIALAKLAIKHGGRK